MMFCFHCVYVLACLCVCCLSYSAQSTLLDFIHPPLNIAEDDSGIQGIDQVYVINLDIRYSRWLRTKEQLEAYGAHPQRVEGINGWKLGRKTLKKFYKNCLVQGTYSTLTPGQVGCLLSHLSILYDAAAHNYQYIWVLEDDILICHDIRELTEVIHRLNAWDSEWEVMFTDMHPRGMWFGDLITFERILGGGFDYSLVQDPHFIPHENEDFVRIQYRLCTHSMIISRQGIKKLLDYFQSIKITFPIDIQMHCCPDKRFYVSKKEYVTNGPRETSDTTYKPHL